MAIQLIAGVIAQRLAAGFSKEAIAAELHRHPRTISREIKRNSIADIYCPVQAQMLTEKRRRDGRQRCRKMANPENVKYVKEWLEERWSPEQIAGRSRREFPQNRRRQLSRQSIYNWLDTYDHQRPLRAFLRRYKRTRRRHTVPSHQSTQALKNRPQIVDERGRDGDWEGDTLVGPGSTALLSMVERRSGYLVLLPVARRRALPVRQACCGRMTQLPPALRQSLTLDNGPEFGQPELLEKAVGVTVYKTEPPSSQTTQLSNPQRSFPPTMPAGNSNLTSPKC